MFCACRFCSLYEIADGPLFPENVFKSGHVTIKVSLFDENKKCVCIAKLLLCNLCMVVHVT